MYVPEERRNGEPLEENWINRDGSDDFAALVDYKDAYRTGARRFDVGQRTNFGLVPMAIAALEQLLEWTVTGVAASLRRVTSEIARRAADLRFSVPSASDHGPHMLGIELPREIARTLGQELTAGGVVASVRGDSLRIAPHLHTTERDIDRLVDALSGATRTTLANRALDDREHALESRRAIFEGRARTSARHVRTFGRRRLELDGSPERPHRLDLAGQLALQAIRVGGAMRRKRDRRPRRSPPRFN